MVHALETFFHAVRGQELSYTPAEDRAPGSREAALAHTLSRHVLNARRRPSRAGVQIGKPSNTARKIDAAMAAVLAYTARNAAIHAGVKPLRRKIYAARRIR
jgi:hypothetical protein